MVDLIGITLAGLLERPMRAALERIWPSPDAMRASVSALVSGQEQHRLAPVLEAASHLELGELEPARACLLRAESEQPNAPVTKLALAMVLARTGVTGDPVVRRVGEALRMNPFLAPGSQPGGSGKPRSGQSGSGKGSSGGGSGQPAALARRGTGPVDALVVQALGSGGAVAGQAPAASRDRGKDLSPGWSLRLTTPAERKNRGLVLSGSDLYGRLIWAAIAVDPVQPGGRITAQYFGRGAGGGSGSQCLAAFGLEHGTLLWARTGKQADRELVLAGHDTLVLRSRKPAEKSLHVLAAASGQQVAEFSPDAFRLLFWPGWRPDSEEFCDPRWPRAHHRFGNPRSTARESATGGSYLLSQELRRDPDLNFAESRSEGRLCDPLADRATPVVIAENVDRLSRNRLGVRRYFEPGTPGRRFWSTIVSSQPPQILSSSTHATLTRFPAR
jgi:hypothetical protein